jgi:glycosyltransferase involved in cell wall biosynthesis
VRAAIERGARLELVLLGETFEALPGGAADLLRELEPHVRERGFADRTRYVAHLSRCDVAVSTARHEFFGVSIAEAMAAGCTPLAPRRLAYPELVPSAMHERCLYDGTDDLAARLVDAAANPRAFRERETRARVRAAIEAFASDRCALRLDELAAATARGERKTSGAHVR